MTKFFHRLFIILLAIYNAFCTPLATAETINYTNGSVYVGSTKNGVPNGRGKQTFPNGVIREGVFINGKYAGTANDVLMAINGQISDYRKFIKEKLNGTFTGKRTFISNNGSKYTGNWLNGKKSGQGTYISPKGDKYVGNWFNGKKSGLGTFTFSEGHKYIGNWLNGKKSGLGTFTWGSIYSCKGNWELGILKGYGYKKTSGKFANEFCYTKGGKLMSIKVSEACKNITSHPDNWANSYTKVINFCSEGQIQQENLVRSNNTSSGQTSINDGKPTLEEAQKWVVRTIDKYYERGAIKTSYSFDSETVITLESLVADDCSLNLEFKEGRITSALRFLYLGSIEIPIENVTEFETKEISDHQVLRIHFDHQLKLHREILVSKGKKTLDFDSKFVYSVTLPFKYSRGKNLESRLNNALNRWKALSAKNCIKQDVF